MHVKLLLVVALNLALNSFAEIATCHQLNSLSREEIFGPHENWYDAQSQTLRKQAESAAWMYVQIYEQPDWLPTLNQIKAMSDQELDAFGENIRFSRSESYHFVNFGFGGGNSFTFIFEADSAKPAARVYEFDGICEVFAK
ncbi:MAG: hypothetical protein WCK49_08825 [Myxococcaceae bacterium]